MVIDAPLLVFLVISFAVLMAAVEIGFLLGRRCRRENDASLPPHANSLQTALLGLLALLLGFTFAMSVSRFDNRKALVMEEANAIGTVYLMAQLLPETAQREGAMTLVRSYVTARIDYYNAGLDDQKQAAATEESSHIQRQLWQEAVDISRKNPHSQPLALYAQSLSHMIDLQEKRLTALGNNVPVTVLYLLFTVAVFGMGFIGYGHGLIGKRHYYSTTLFAVMVLIVICVIMDIDRPRRGFVMAGQQSLLRLQQDISQPPVDTKKP